MYYILEGWDYVGVYRSEEELLRAAETVISSDYGTAEHLMASVGYSGLTARAVPAGEPTYEAARALILWNADEAKAYIE